MTDLKKQLADSLGVADPVELLESTTKIIEYLRLFNHTPRSYIESAQFMENVTKV